MPHSSDSCVFIYSFIYLFYVHVWVMHVFICTVCMQVPREARRGHWIPKELELYILSFHIDAGNGTQVTRESSEHS